ncbi:unnamed protein product, partial [Ectocarpus sp. 4 AP-2014]
MARLILDSGSALTSIGTGLLRQMAANLGHESLQMPLVDGPRRAKTATGAPVEVTHKTVPTAVSIRTPWGAVQLEPITFAVMPGEDNVVLFGTATMKKLGIDLYPLALEKLRPLARPRGPDMFMDSAEERGARDRALEDSVQQAEQSGLSADGTCRLRDILARRVGAFRRALRGDPPARVGPMRVQLKPGARAVKAKPRRY